ncbi:MAG: AraC family transcriptional regulator [Gammaproteobacteria bacterium]
MDILKIRFLRPLLVLLLITSLSVLTTVSISSAAGTKTSISDENLDGAIQALKQEILNINSDLSILENDFLFPINARITIFVSLDTNEDFDLKSVKVKLDEKIIATHIYSQRELVALRLGGVQRLYINSLEPGEHELIVNYTGQGRNAREFRRASVENFTKSNNPQYVELNLSQKNSRRQPEFILKIWD